MKSIWKSVSSGRRQSALSILAGTLIIILGFQNCSRVAFDPAPESSSSLSPLSADYVNGKPTAKMSLNEGALYTKDTSARVQITSAKAKDMLLKNDVCPGEKETLGWEAFQEKSNFVLTGNDGNKRVFARIRDEKNIVSECIDASILLDQQAPLIQTLQSTDKVSSNKDSVFLFDATDAGSGIDKFYCRVTGQNQYSVCQPRVEMRGLSDGSKTLNVYATDKAGNQSTPTDFSWLIDTVPPTVQIVAPFVPALLAQRTAAISFVGADPEGSGIDSFQCTLNGQAVTPCSSPQAFSNLVNGNYEFIVVAVDKAGLSSMAAKHSFTVDANASDDFQILGLTGGTDVKIDPYLTANSNPTLHWGSSNGAQSYNIQVYNQNRSQLLCQFNNVAANITSLALGNCGGWSNNTRYSISMVAIRNGITKAAPNLLVAIDYSGPTINITKLTKEDDLKRATIEFTISDFSGVGSATCTKIFGGDTKQDTCVSKTSIQYTNLLEGKHDFFIAAVDTLGNSAQSQTVSFTMDYVVCDPFRMIEGKCQKGLKANLFYARAAERAEDAPKDIRTVYPTAVSMINNGLKSNSVLYLPSLDVRTRAFTEGFTTTGKDQLKDDDGKILDEWFGLRLETVFKLGPQDSPGYYQLIILSDDGSNVYLNNQIAIRNDKLQSTTVGCMDAGQVMQLDNTTRIPAKIEYFQGPRTQISLSLFWRKVNSPQAARSQYCGSNTGQVGWGFGIPENYELLKNEGFKPLAPENFITNEEVKL